MTIREVLSGGTGASNSRFSTPHGSKGMRRFVVPSPPGWREQALPERVCVDCTVRRPTSTRAPSASGARLRSDRAAGRAGGSRRPEPCVGHLLVALRKRCEQRSKSAARLVHRWSVEKCSARGWGFSLRLGSWLWKSGCTPPPEEGCGCNGYSGLPDRPDGAAGDVLAVRPRRR